MLPVRRWSLSLFGMLLSSAAFAQAAQPTVDESKIPEWVKRQARSPYKVIIESNTVRTRPAAAKPEDAAKQAVRKTAPVKPNSPTAAPVAEEARVAASDATPTPAPVVEPAPGIATASTPGLTPEPAITSSPVATVTLPSSPDAAPPTAVQPAPAKETASRPEPTPVAPNAPAPAPVPLTLVKRVEPALSADLIDGRLNTARVVVAFTVNTSGEVINPSVATTTDTRLNRSVLRAVQAWRYAPIPEPREHMVSFAFTSE